MSGANKSPGSRWLLFLGVVLPLLFYGYPAWSEGGHEYSEYRTGVADAPIIERALAVDTISPGATWRVYLWASDPNGDISSVTYAVDQPGIADYGFGYLRVKPGADGRLSGYLYLNTVSLAHSSGWQMWYTVRIAVQDSAGNRSAPRLFRVSFNGNRQEDVRRWEKVQLASMGVAEPPRLGRINVDLVPLEDQPGAAGIFVGGP